MRRVRSLHHLPRDQAAILGGMLAGIQIGSRRLVRPMHQATS